MTTPVLVNLEKMLAQGKDSAMLRFSLGSEHLKLNQPQVAVTHLAKAVEWDANYSAAWKLLGKAHQAAGQLPQALAAWRQGAQVARAKGDVQAAKEMEVFARRIEKQLGETS